MRINIRCVADLKEVARSNSGLKTCAAVLRRLSTLSLDSFTDGKDTLSKVKRMEINGLPIIHHDGYVCEFPVKHRFAMRKFHGVLRFLKTDNVISMKQVLKPSAIDPNFLKLVHTPDYVDRFLSGNTSVEEQRRTGFQWSTGIVSRCRLETGFYVYLTSC